MTRLNNEIAILKRIVQRKEEGVSVTRSVWRVYVLVLVLLYRALRCSPENMALASNSPTTTHTRTLFVSFCSHVS